MKIVEGVVATPYARIAIALARNHFINHALLDGAVDILKRIGQVADDNILVVHVPSVDKLPLTACCLSKQGDFDAIIALGSVIRSEIEQYHEVITQCRQGLAHLELHTELPVLCGILVLETLEQATSQTGIKTRHNKGSEAALTALEMINVLQTIKN